ncbi:DUF1826 domain-containing protein [Pseudooceanicola sp. CBS1P-1]|uniref:DUF1826 domain-containing protein n=1 Tax=Pseudooceanicola albus TaxID=2692189 RepID=A0A6L7G725_9RHOB|nr:MULTISPECIES: DUF1826 domain-containing protein [Pseudooceanicola]MBT9386839.1 DUF1826 domain-containing protein [Pseudooceanicola endophyticus]MXN19338.1 DUF1826 domain-containing protein [Pseudooceanicola albus]
MRDLPMSCIQVAEGSDPEILSQIRSPGTAAAIWQREAPALTRWLDGLPPGQLPSLRRRLVPAEVPAALEDACTESAMPQTPGRQSLIADITARAGQFARLMRVPAVRLRLDVLAGDACTRFHLDNVPARLLCTYRGSGTEYGLAAPGGQPVEIRQLQPGWVGLFRGLSWPAEPQPGLLHRSPPISGSGQTRLLLVIDVAGDD